MRFLHVCSLRFMFAVAVAVGLAGCGSSTAPKAAPKPDPWITIHVTDGLDTATAAGRATWVAFTLLTGPQAALNGLAPFGQIGLRNIRNGSNSTCEVVAADSIGQRDVAMLALADTADTTTNYWRADTLAQQWYAGSHALPAGWAAITTAPQDAFNSQQYAAGHGRTAADPIRWEWAWTPPETSSFTEAPSDTTCSAL